MSEEEKIVYKEGMDKLKCKCADPDCSGNAEGIYLHSKCHPAVPTWVKYENGILTVLCAKMR